MPEEGVRMNDYGFKTIKANIYDMLRDRIISGYYLPDAKLNEAEIANEFQVSRSPVREAIQRLIGNGLVESKPYKGVFVIAPTQENLNDIYEFRTVLENFAIEKGINTLTDADRQHLIDLQQRAVKAYQEYDMSEYLAADADLHDTIILASRNEAVIDAYNRASERIRPFRVYSLLAGQRFHESKDEHDAIIAGILEGDAKKATKANSLHLEKARMIIERYMDEREVFLEENAEHLQEFLSHMKF